MAQARRVNGQENRPWLICRGCHRDHAGPGIHRDDPGKEAGIHTAVRLGDFHLVAVCEAGAHGIQRLPMEVVSRVAPRPRDASSRNVSVAISVTESWVE